MTKMTLKQLQIPIRSAHETVKVIFHDFPGTIHVRFPELSRTIHVHFPCSSQIV